MSFWLRETHCLRSNATELEVLLCNPEYSGAQRRSVTKSTHLQGGPHYSVSRSLAATYKLTFSKLGVAKQLDQDEQGLERGTIS